MTQAIGDRVGRRTLALAAFACFCGLVLLVPWEPLSLPPDGGDGMFHPLAHHQFAAGMPWGATSLHTSGPWGFVRFPYYLPDTYGLLVAINGLVAAAVAAAMGGMARRFRRRGSAWLLIPLGTWLLALSDDARWLFALLACLAFVPDFARRRTTATFVSLLLMTAFACTVKGTFLLAGIPVAAVVGALELRARRWPVHLLAFAIAATGSWWLAVGGLDGVAEHLRHVLESTVSYPEAFSLPADLRRVAAFAVLGGCFLMLALACELHERGPANGILVWLGFALVVWMLYKGAFTRFDVTHVSRSVLALLVFSLFFLLSRWEALSEGALARLAAGRAGEPVLIALLLLTGWVCVAGFQPPHRQLALLDAKLHGLTAVWGEGRAAQQRRYERSLREIRSRFPIPASVRGPIGVFGTLHTPILANGLAVAPMPVVAHYEIWSPRTVELTNAFLAGDGAPEYLLLTGTNPSASNAIRLASRYQPFAAVGRATLLLRRPEALPVQRETVLQADLVWGEALRIPAALADEILIARLDYHLTLLGRATAFVYQPPRVTLRILRRDGQDAEIRINRLLAADGIALDARPGAWDERSPNVHRQRHALLSEGGHAGVREIRLSGGLARGGDPRPYLGDRVHVRIDTVRFGAAPNAGASRESRSWVLSDEPSESTATVP